MEHGKNGLLIEPTGEALVAALRWAVERRESLAEIGAAGRIRAEQHFDGYRNDRAIVDLALEFAIQAPIGVRDARIPRPMAISSGPANVTGEMRHTQ